MNYYNQSYMGGYPYQYVPMPQPQQSQLNGKIVDGIDIVKATEVPTNGYGVFPKADLSEIYIKSWNNNGTTNIITFKPVIQELQSKDEITQLIERFDALENKIDNLVAYKKETKANEY